MNDDQILPGRCPYCGARYTLNAGGCEQQCPISESAKRIVRMAAEWMDMHSEEA